MVGDRGMITTARIEAIRALGGLGWITSLRAPAIRALADAGALQLSLFDETNLAEITGHPDYPGERLVACRNPALAIERARKRQELLAATETLLEPIVNSVSSGRLVGADKIGVRVGKIINRYKMAKHFTLAIADTSFVYTQNRAQIAAEAALDGIYIVRTSVTADRLDTAGVVDAYKGLKVVEADFRSLKTIDLDLRPIHHWTEPRVRAHVFICMLAAYLVWHLRRAWAPLCFTDEDPPARTDPVARARRSTKAATKASRRQAADGQPAHSLGTLLDELATLTRNTIVFAGGTRIDKLATPTPLQRRAFELIDATIPTTLHTK
jgi:transposase